MVNNKDIQRVILEKAKMDAENQRETTVTIEGNGVISIGGKAVAKKPNKPFRNTFKASQDFVANSLRAVLKDHFEKTYEGSFARKGNLVVNEKDNDYVISVSKLKFNVEENILNYKSEIMNEVVSLIKSLNGLSIVQTSNNILIVQTLNFQQYQIKITKKRDRISREVPTEVM